MLPREDIHAARIHAVDAARTVGKLIVEKQGSFRRASSSSSNTNSEDSGLEIKSDAASGNSSDIVTAIDKLVEKTLIEILCAKGSKYENYSVLGEEEFSAAEGSEKGGSYGLSERPTWVIDPIDGTTNFVHGFPLVAVSIALVVDFKSVVGVVFNPVLDEMFEAELGGGAFLNGKPLPSRGIPAAADGNPNGEPLSLQQAIIATNVGYDRSADGCNFTSSHILELLRGKVRSVRMGGSAACDICWVAAGRTDAFYEWGIHPWDIAAATLVLTECGGYVCDPSGDPLDLTARRVLAAGNHALSAEIVAILTKTPAPENWAKRQS
jgi:fructose-1,6-bisphosphatase/inositol monophosphatase family enzyme